jgi:hypothetical protein
MARASVQFHGALLYEDRPDPSRGKGSFADIVQDFRAGAAATSAAPKPKMMSGRYLARSHRDLRHRLRCHIDCCLPPAI